ncbi:MAG: hypothetical protein K5799_08755 [Erythrobacter sp.]|nr:hypothetical protein [Erythrobacter sp.]
MRNSLFLFAVAALAACSQSPDAEDEPAGRKIDCALAGAAEFEKVCTLETAGGEGEFVIHHPDGGFRRFSLGADGRIAVTDGADELVNAGNGASGGVAFAVGPDRYIVPAAALERQSHD